MIHYSLQMQKTRLTVLIDVASQQISQSLRNPWRRVSLILISLLFGNFAATVVATVTGQAARWDVIVAIILIGGCELISWWVYRYRPAVSERMTWGNRLSGQSSPDVLQQVPQPYSYIGDVVNSVKIGFVYGMFVEALKLGS